MQDWSFTYDEAGNLRTRARSTPTELADSIETFGYDSLDRLTTTGTNYPSAPWLNGTDSYEYNYSGNITKKNGDPYTYGNCNAGPHAVCSVGGIDQFVYDANGNMTSGNHRTVGYNPSNKPIHIESQPSSLPGSTTATVDFIYGADGQRVVQSVGTVDGGESARTVYVGLGGTGKSIYERTTHVTSSATTVEHVHFLYAGGAHGGNAFALYVATSDVSGNVSDAATKYYHFDHLGSVTAMSDANGRVVGPSSGGGDATVFRYDAWGARRDSGNQQVGHREFTSHETIPDVGLVNMNGRVYDPVLGRFLTPDPSVQFVANLQSYNRYSYAANNPLRYTDPTGYGFWSFLSSGSFWMGAFQGAFVAFGCLASDGLGCVAAGIWVATMNAATSLAKGASFDQVAPGFMLSVAGSGLGIAAGVAGAGLNPILVNATSMVVASALTTAVTGGGWEDLGHNLVVGIASSAVSAGIIWSMQAVSQISQSSAQQQQGGEAYRKFTASELVDAKGLDGELRAHPLLTYEDENGYRQLTGYWREKLQPFYAGRDLDLRQVWVRGQDLPPGVEGVTRYGSESNVVNIDYTLLKGQDILTLSTFLHESMHIVQGDAVGLLGMEIQSRFDRLRFGPFDDWVYDWRRYPGLTSASYADVSITGAGFSYPVEAGFNRFAADVINNLSACGGVCP
jgi:RHS repeat-associated protein